MYEACDVSAVPVVYECRDYTPCHRVFVFLDRTREMSYSLLSRADWARNWASGAGNSAMTGCMKRRVCVCGNVALGIYTHTKDNSRTELETVEVQNVMSRGICKNKKHTRRDVMLHTRQGTHTSYTKKRYSS